MPDQKQRIDSLDYLRAVAILMVVGIHAKSYSAPLSGLSLEVVNFLVHQVAVPAFFFADGYLLAAAIAAKGAVNYGKYVGDSARRLLIPWLIFSIGYLLARILAETSGVVADKIVVGKSAGELFTLVYASGHAPQLYFLVSLFLIRLVAPHMLPVLLSRGLVFSLCIVALWVFLYQASSKYLSAILNVGVGQEPVLHALQGLQFYLAGAGVWMLQKSMGLRLLLLVSLCIFFAAAMLKYFASLAETSIVFQIAYLVALFGAVSFLRPESGLAKSLKMLGERTMGVYLLHVPVLMKVCSLLVLAIVASPLGSYVAILISSLLLSFVLTLIVERTSLAKVLLGQAPKR